MILDHQGQSGEYLTSGDLSSTEHLRRFWDWTVTVVLWYEYSSTAVSYIRQTEKPRVYLSTTTAKYCCIASGTAVVSYKTALRSTTYHHRGLHERQRQLHHQCHQETQDVRRQNASHFRYWHNKMAVVLGVTRRDIASLINGKSRWRAQNSRQGDCRL